MSSTQSNFQKTSFITSLECSNCGKKFDATRLQTVCDACGKVLYPRYDLEQAKEFLTPKHIQAKKNYSIWRWNEIMPILDTQFHLTLGEGWTPEIQLKNLGNDFGLSDLWIKDEGQNPTGTFKSRGLCAAVAKATEFGIKEFVIPSAGNAGAALTAYASHAGGVAHVYVPKDAPPFVIQEINNMGAELTLVDGLISDAGKLAKEAADKNGWWSVSTLKEPYRVEGKKTMGLELAEHFDWHLPDAIIYPTGGGTGIVGMWKAFDEMEQLGLIDSHRPKMISVQPEGCQPMVRALNNGDKFAEPWQNAQSIAGGIRVPGAIGDYLILNAIRESKGTAIAISDSEMKDMMRVVARREGTMLCPESTATLVAAKKLRESGFLDASDKIIAFATGSGLTVPDMWD